MKKKLYAYSLPSGEKGVLGDWPSCEKKVKGVKDAKYQGFPSEAEAKDWLGAGASYGMRKKMPPGIYFDSGTGRGRGVEINVTNEEGKSLLDKVLPKESISRVGSHFIFKDVSNNYGELLACKYALQIALAGSIKSVSGDSKLIIDFWSRGFVKKGEAPGGTIELVQEVKKLREEFESLGGEMAYVSGEDNPADLGFHK